MKQTIYTLLAMLAASVSTPAAADDYLPLVREGVRWHYNNINFSGGHHVEDYNYYYEFKGDTIINGNVYKKLYETVYNGAVEEPSFPTGERFPLSPMAETTELAACMIEKDKVVYCTDPYSGIGHDFGNDDVTELGVVVYDFNQSSEDKTGEYSVQGVKCNQYYIQNPQTRFYADEEDVELYKDIYYINLIEGIGYIYGESSEYQGTVLYPYSMRPLCCFTTSFMKVTDTEDNVLFDPYNTVKNGVDDVKVAEVKGDDRYYNLQGQAVDIKTAPAGIYIHNGKKVVVK